MKRSLLSFYIGFTEHPEPIIGSYVVQLPQAASQVGSLFSVPESDMTSEYKVFVNSIVYGECPDEYKHLLEICDKPFPL